MYSRLFEDEIALAFHDPDWATHFVDIGAGDGRTWSNSLLFAEKGWSGSCFEINPIKLEVLRMVHANRPQVQCLDYKVNVENIAMKLRDIGTPHMIGVLSVDIDGIDAFVLNEILFFFKPQIIIAEFNHLVPPPIRFCVNYDPDWVWGRGGFFGASIDHLNDICESQSYGLQNVIGGNGIWMWEKPAAGTTEQLWRSEHIPFIRMTNGADTIDLESGVRIDLPDAAKLACVNEMFSKFNGQFTLSKLPLAPTAH